MYVNFDYDLGNGFGFDFDIGGFVVDDRREGGVG